MNNISTDDNIKTRRNITKWKTENKIVDEHGENIEQTMLQTIKGRL